MVHVLIFQLPTAASLPTNSSTKFLHPLITSTPSSSSTSSSSNKHHHPHLLTSARSIPSFTPPSVACRLLAAAADTHLHPGHSDLRSSVDGRLAQSDNHLQPDSKHLRKENLENRPPPPLILSPPGLGGAKDLLHLETRPANHTTDKHSVITSGRDKERLPQVWLSLLSAC